MCRGCHCKSSLPLILKKLNNFPVLHGVLQINVMITLAWGGMWKTTPGAAPFPRESFPSELAITQQLAGVRERGCLWSPATEGLGLPLRVAGLCHIRGHMHHPVPVSPGQAVRGSAFAECSYPG